MVHTGRKWKRTVEGSHQQAEQENVEEGGSQIWSSSKTQEYHRRQGQEGEDQSDVVVLDESDPHMSGILKMQRQANWTRTTANFGRSFSGCTPTGTLQRLLLQVQKETGCWKMGSHHRLLAAESEFPLLSMYVVNNVKVFPSHMIACLNICFDETVSSSSLFCY